MKFTRLEPEGVWLLELEPAADERGFFARAWDGEEFAARGLVGALAHVSVSFNHRRGTIRGLHFQAAPQEEAKLVRCTAGGIFDVAVDVRHGSPTRGRWTAVELTSANRRALYVPPGFAHGFQSLSDGAEVLYQISTRYFPELARGVRWDDPEVGVAWPIGDPILSDRDRRLPLLSEQEGTPGGLN